MIGVPPHDFDKERFAKLVALFLAAPPYQRPTLLAYATRCAASAGLSLAEGIESVAEYAAKPVSALMDGYQKDKQLLAELAQHERAQAIRRQSLLQVHGDPERVMDRSPLEQRLFDTVGHIKPGDLVQFGHFRWEDMNEELRNLILSVEPRRVTPFEAIAEILEWEEVRQDRRALWNYDHDWWIDARLRALEHVVDMAPAISFKDVEARLHLWRMRSGVGVLMSPSEEQTFQWRLIGHLKRLEKLKTGSKPTTTKARTAQVQTILRQEPERSDRDIGRQVGCSASTVAKWRRERATRPIKSAQ